MTYLEQLAADPSGAPAPGPGATSAEGNEALTGSAAEDETPAAGLVAESEEGKQPVRAVANGVTPSHAAEPGATSGIRRGMIVREAKWPVDVTAYFCGHGL